MAQIDPTALAHLPKTYLEEDIGKRLIIVAAVFIVLQTVFVSFYYISRYINKNLNSWECWILMPMSYILATAVCICSILIVEIGGGGRHVEAVLIQDPTGGILITRSKIEKAVELIYVLAITCSKLVLLCLYMRIFNTSRRYRLATYFVASIVVLNWLADLIISFTICKPFASQWDHSIPGGKCGDIIRVYQFISIPNIVTDVMMLALPLPALYKLHVDLGTKISLFVTFMMGSVGMIISILRLNTFVHELELFRDPTFNCIPNYMYTIAEAGTYLIVACMPSLRPLKRHVFGDSSLSKKIGTYISKQFGGSNGHNSFGFRFRKRDVQLASMRKAASSGLDVERASTSHLDDERFVNLDEHSDTARLQVTVDCDV